MLPLYQMRSVLGKLTLTNMTPIRGSQHLIKRALYVFGRHCLYRYNKRFRLKYCTISLCGGEKMTFADPCNRQFKEITIPCLNCAP